MVATGGYMVFAYLHIYLFAHLLVESLAEECEHASVAVGLDGADDVGVSVTSELAYVPSFGYGVGIADAELCGVVGEVLGYFFAAVACELDALCPYGASGDEELLFLAKGVGDELWLLGNHPK